MSKSYYFISDLHLGDDDPLAICEFEKELIRFLRKLEKENINTELIIAGDMFGIWEMEEGKPEGKLKKIIKNNKAIFEQFQKTGKAIKITLIPGNHDHDLACYKEHKKTLKEYNIYLEAKQHITRRVGDGLIWIEHGNQHDPMNKISEFGNPHARPIGYYIASEITGMAEKRSIFGKKKWLKDMGCVRPNEHVPDWLISNYFYREMSPFIRLILLPFLLLFGVSLIVVAGMQLEKFGILNTEFFRKTLTGHLWIFGNVLDAIFFVNGTVILFLLLIAVPLWFIVRDLKKMLQRYEIKTDRFKERQRKVYIEVAKKIFRKNKDVSIFIFGHSHEAFLEKIGNKIIINTGTWLKTLTRIPARFRLVPDVYFPSYRLNYFKVSNNNGVISVDYKIIPKKAKKDLTPLQRFVIFLRKRNKRITIPEKVVL